MTFCIVNILFWLLFTRATKEAAAEEEIHITMKEEVRAGSYVVNVVEKSSLKTRLKTSEKSDLQFRFLTKHGYPFVIEKRTGNIKTSGRIDRDQICPYKASCVIKLDVALFPVENFEILKVLIQLIDINDINPTFAQQDISYDILESAEPGMTFAIPTALDADSPSYSVKSYSLMPQNAKFKLEVLRSEEGLVDMQLVLEEELDREQKDKYELIVVAEDGGEPPNKGSLRIHIKVNDANDHNPVFNASKYEVSVEENIPTHKTIIRVMAKDADEGYNGDVRYNFTSRTIQSYGHLFGINDRSGEIYVKDEIDFEKGALYHLAVTARDRGQGSMPADAVVIVKVTDQNDHSPEITVNTITASDTSRAAVPEDAEVGSFVAQVTVKDVDSGLNARFSCGLDDSHFRLKSILDTEYQIVTAAMFDRETRYKYRVKITCADEGTPPRHTEYHLRILISDVNDNTPYFRKGEYTASLVENNIVGALVVRVNATDRDSGENGRLEYRIEEAAQKWFRVEPDDGSIKAVTMINREEIDKAQFKVYAVDNGETPRTATASVFITIIDVNDEAPVFGRSNYMFTVLEDEPTETSVGRVYAVDRDEPPSSHFRFSLAETIQAKGNFAIDAKSGIITTLRTFDRERASQYQLMAIATDEGIVPMSSSASIRINIGDRNDNKPIVLFPSRENHSVEISSQLPVGHFVARIIAHDTDAGRNSRLTYLLRKSATKELQLMELDAVTGTIRVARDMSGYAYARLELQIVVHDNGRPRLNASTMLNVVVNKSIPYFDATRQAMDDFVVVMGVACGAGAIAVVLIIAIIVVCRKDKERKAQRYNCRSEALKVLEKDAKPGDDAALIQQVHNAPPVNGALNGSATKQHHMSLDALQAKNSAANLASRGGSPLPLVTSPLPPYASVYNTMPCVPPSNQHNAYATSPAPQQRPQWTITQNELEAHHVMQKLRESVVDARSDHSGEGSLTDSGHGASDEGEGRAGMHHLQPHLHKLSRLICMTQLPVPNCNNTPFATPNPPPRCCLCGAAQGLLRSNSNRDRETRL